MTTENLKTPAPPTNAPDKRPPLKLKSAINLAREIAARHDEEI